MLILMQSLIVIKRRPVLPNTARLLDPHWKSEGILGTIAGDDTIFCYAHNDKPIDELLKYPTFIWKHIVMNILLTGGTGLIGKALVEQLVLLALFLLRHSWFV